MHKSSFIGPFVICALTSVSSASPEFYGFTRASVGGRSLTSGNDISAGGYVAMSGANGAVWHPSFGFVHEFIPDDAIGVSNDGSVVATQGGNRSRVWTSEFGTQQLSNSNSFIGGISGNGALIVGSNRDADQAFVWDQQNGYRLLGGLQGVNGESTARAISSDGQTIVGSSWNGSTRTAVTFSTNGVFTDLGVIDGYENAEAQGVSSDGRYVVGAARTGLNFGAFRWDRETGVTESLGGAFLGLAGFNANDVSDTGVVVGQSYNDDTDVRTALIYDDHHGWRSVADMLASEYDITLDPRWQLENVYSISPDGTMITGSGLYTNDNGGREVTAWVAVIPSPSSLPSVVLGMTVCVIRRR
ncbi:MAG: hypothetical protein JJ974_04650, partial [Phycisphaerales bacterium]|nr:hypothetical protein [Phycisphaerales bacterium]